MLHIEFLTDLGARVTVDVESADKLLDTQRHYGRLGWTSGEVPLGGYQFPLENEPDFDWTLIGARKWTNPEGEEMVIHKGHAYRRRELEAVDSRKMKLPAAVKYSRGAKSTDPEHLREKSDGEFEYVTLAIFRGGKRQERYAAGAASAGPASGAARAAAPQTRPAAGTRPAPAAPTGGDAPMNRGQLLNALNTKLRDSNTPQADILTRFDVKALSALSDDQIRSVLAEVS